MNMDKCKLRALMAYDEKNEPLKDFQVSQIAVQNIFLVLAHLEIKALKNGSFFLICRNNSCFKDLKCPKIILKQYGKCKLPCLPASPGDLSVMYQS